MLRHQPLRALTAILIFTALAIALTTIEARADQPTEKLLRVRLFTGKKQVIIRALSLHELGAKRQVALIAAPGKEESVEVKIERKKIKNAWVWSVKNGTRTVTEETALLKPELPFDGKMISIDGRKIPGKFVLVEKKDRMDVIALLPVEDYVLGVLISEMPTQWPLEALKAQAVAIRSYALAVSRERRKDDYHLESTVLDQVFHGYHEGEVLAPKYGNAALAVRETEGWVLVDREKTPRVKKAFYHSDCGGNTILPEEVWGVRKPGKKETVVAVDPACAKRASSRWQAAIPVEQLQAVIKGSTLEMISAGLSLTKEIGGRVRSLIFRGGEGETLAISGNELREKAGYDRVKSTRFDIETTEDQVIIRGRGYGHGAGLCQWGSRDWANQGWSHRKILEHYYPKSLVVKLARQIL